MREFRQQQEREEALGAAGGVPATGPQAASTPIKGNKSKNKSRNKRAKSVAFQADEAVNERKRSASRPRPSPGKALSNITGSEAKRQLRASARSRTRADKQTGNGVTIGQWRSY